MTRTFLNSLSNLPIAKAQANVLDAGFDVANCNADTASAFPAMSKTVILYHTNGVVVKADAGDVLEVEE